MSRIFQRVCVALTCFLFTLPFSTAQAESVGRPRAKLAKKLYRLELEICLKGLRKIPGASAPEAKEELDHIVKILEDDIVAGPTIERLAKAFTEDELRHVVEMYESPELSHFAEKRQLMQEELQSEIIEAIARKYQYGEYLKLAVENVKSPEGSKDMTELQSRFDKLEERLAKVLKKILKRMEFDAEYRSAQEKYDSPHCQVQSAQVVEGRQEIPIYIDAPDPVQIEFPAKVLGGFRQSNGHLSLDRRENLLVIFASDGLPERGQVLLVALEGQGLYPLRVMPADKTHPHRTILNIKAEPVNFAGDEKSL